MDPKAARLLAAGKRLAKALARLAAKTDIRDYETIQKMLDEWRIACYELTPESELPPRRETPSNYFERAEKPSPGSKPPG